MEPIRREHIVRGITAVRRARCLSIETVAKEMGLSRHALRNLYRTNREPAQMTVWKIQAWLRKNALAVLCLRLQGRRRSRWAVSFVRSARSSRATSTASAARLS
mgnify:CR=1 FL=1